MSACLHDDSKPIFEVRDSEGHAMQIYSDGRIKGFPKEYSFVVNGIAPLIKRCEALITKKEG